jgi:phytoene/squalene synthetase
MKSASALLARSITRSSSKQSFYTACLLVDRDLVDDCCRAYGYFRWADDVIDLNSLPREKRVAFIERQKDLVERLYRGELPTDLCSEEEILADLIRHDRGENSGLQSFIRNFMAILEFDAHRKGQLINQQELTWYSDCLGRAVTDAIQYFVSNGYPYPNDPNRYLAATAAHITHMLRDLRSDLDEGYINIPREYLEEQDLDLKEVENPTMRSWVKAQAEMARQYFREGKRYLDQLDVLRCKIAGYWYCLRFECDLAAIEKDGYILRANYNERRKPSTQLKLIKLATTLTMQHVSRQLWRRNHNLRNITKEHRDAQIRQENF